MKKKAQQPLKITKPINHSKFIYRLMVTLGDVSPKVYRVLLVPGSFHLGQLHMLIQMSFGWNNSHLHEFVIGTKAFIDTIYDEGGSGKPRFDETKFILGLGLSLGQKFSYDYDFGDNWSHDIKVLGIEASLEGFEYPMCIEGKNACPPDDCGGVHRYEELKKLLKSKDPKKRSPALRWLGGQFDPSVCDPNRLNRDMIWRFDWYAT